MSATKAAKLSFQPRPQTGAIARWLEAARAKTEAYFSPPTTEETLLRKCPFLQRFYNPTTQQLEAAQLQLGFINSIHFQEPTLYHTYFPLTDLGYGNRLQTPPLARLSLDLGQYNNPRHSGNMVHIIGQRDEWYLATQNSSAINYEALPLGAIIANSKEAVVVRVGRNRGQDDVQLTARKTSRRHGTIIFDKTATDLNIYYIDGNTSPVTFDNEVIQPQGSTYGTAITFESDEEILIPMFESIRRECSKV